MPPDTASTSSEPAVEQVDSFVLLCQLRNSFQVPVRHDLGKEEEAQLEHSVPRRVGHVRVFGAISEALHLFSDRSVDACWPRRQPRALYCSYPGGWGTILISSQQFNSQELDSGAWFKFSDETVVPLTAKSKLGLQEEDGMKKVLFPIF